MSKLIKAKLERLDRTLSQPVGDPVYCEFNPTEVTFNKGAQIAEIAIPGIDMPILQFVRGQTETLALELFFDTTDKGMGDTVTAVTTLTDAFYQLIKIDRQTHAPPICRFSWGTTGFPGSNLTDQWASQNRQNGFQCVVESVRQRFTLFSPNGVPLRATLTVSLKEHRSLKQQLDSIGFESPDHTSVHIVQSGDTLSRIAATAYGDPGLWRAIADENQLMDPLSLTPGQVLTIPPIR